MSSESRSTFCRQSTTSALPDTSKRKTFRTFASATLMVMPYSSATGSSGVAHMACEYGLPIVCADIADFREMCADEQFAISFFKTGDAHSMADCIVSLLENPAAQREMGEANFSVALRQTMPMIIRQYLRSFHHAATPGCFASFLPFPQVAGMGAAAIGNFSRCRAQVVSMELGANSESGGLVRLSPSAPGCVEFAPLCWWGAGRRWNASANFPWLCSTYWGAACLCARSIAFELPVSVRSPCSATPSRCRRIRRRFRASSTWPVRNVSGTRRCSCFADLASNRSACWYSVLAPGLRWISRRWWTNTGAREPPDPRHPPAKRRWMYSRSPPAASPRLRLCCAENSATSALPPPARNIRLCKSADDAGRPAHPHPGRFCRRMRHSPLWPRTASRCVDRQGRACSSSTRASLRPPSLGAFCNVRRAAIVTRGSSLEHHRRLDCATVIDNSSIMPYTRIGAGLDVEYSVAGFNQVHSLKHNVILPVEDPLLLGVTRTHFSARLLTAASGFLASCRMRWGSCSLDPGPEPALGASRKTIQFLPPQHSVTQLWHPSNHKRNPTRKWPQRGDMETSRPVIVKRVPESLNLKQARAFLKTCGRCWNTIVLSLFLIFRWCTESMPPE